jgi:predicted DCC family thiol-disulfide oxidoreductase YuxK
MNAGSDPPIVVFDAVCVLCCSGLRWILRHDSRAHWRFLAMQSRRGAAALTTAGISPQTPTSFLVLYQGHGYIESDACLIIARNRYRWFGRRENCYVPTANERHRYLTD